MAFQSQIMSLVCFGQFLELGSSDKENQFRISLQGLTLSVPVTKDQFDNPPQFGAPGMVRGALTTSDFNGRPVAKHLTWTPITDESLWPTDGILNRFEGVCDISKDFYFTKLGEKVSFVRFDAMSFTYQYAAPQEVLDRFTPGMHAVFGQLKADQTMAAFRGDQKNKLTVWKCIPLGMLKTSSRSKQ